MNESFGVGSDWVRFSEKPDDIYTEKRLRNIVFHFQNLYSFLLNFNTLHFSGTFQLLLEDVILQLAFWFLN